MRMIFTISLVLVACASCAFADDAQTRAIIEAILGKNSSAAYGGHGSHYGTQEYEVEVQELRDLSKNIPKIGKQPWDDNPYWTGFKPSDVEIQIPKQYEVEVRGGYGANYGIHKYDVEVSEPPDLSKNIPKIGKEPWDDNPYWTGPKPGDIEIQIPKQYDVKVKRRY